MPLSASTLSAALRVKMLASPAIQAIDGAGLTALCDAISQAVVEHVVANAVVTVSVTASGTAPPGGGVVPSTGSGTGTVA